MHKHLTSASEAIRDADHRPGVGPLDEPDAETLTPLRQRVFERIRAAGALPRSQVAKDLGVSPGSVTPVVAALIEAGLLEEIAARGDCGRGRPAVALGVRRDAGVVAGIKLSDAEHTAVLTDFAGGLIASEMVRAPPGDRTLAGALHAVEALMARVCAKGGVAPAALAAVGVGLPGFVEHASGRVLWSPILRERDAPFAAAASGLLGLPVHVDNDANLVALAELWFGVGRALSDFAVITIEHGVGLGVVINHRLYRGSRGVGAELGHVKVELDGALCRCGQRGCLEAYVADYALVREGAVALELPAAEGRPTGALLESLFDHAKAGNEAARSIFRRAGRYLTVGIANVVNLFDPSLIILSGERMRYDYLYSDEALGELGRLVVAADRPPPPIEVHAWGDLLWAHGAAALALSETTGAALRPRSCP